ncbi:MAG: ABC transporter ATP-binding protein [Verrucomicrobia bacterium]|nr:ABC transporter ATP-binding protein [Verrucomicrobiota bacterium]
MLEIENLTISFVEGAEETVAVDGLSLSVRPGETLAIVGESGSGKSVTALSLARLLPEPPARIRQGKILLDGQSVLEMSSQQLSRMRGKEIGYVFQEPATSLSPVFTIYEQIAETLRRHRPEVRAVKAEVIRWLDHVGIRDPERRLRDYPFQLSGGMQQRVMIAMALSAQPKLLVADEPTTALDVTIQKQILDLFRTLKAKFGMTTILITHNFGVIQDLADRVAVMFRGKLVELGSYEQVVKQPAHPYTRALLECVPRLGSKLDRLKTIDYAQFTVDSRPA